MCRAGFSWYQLITFVGPVAWLFVLFVWKTSKLDNSTGNSPMPNPHVALEPAVVTCKSQPGIMRKNLSKSNLPLPPPQPLGILLFKHYSSCSVYNKWLDQFLGETANTSHMTIFPFINIREAKTVVFNYCLFLRPRNSWLLWPWLFLFFL